MLVHLCHVQASQGCFNKFREPSSFQRTAAVVNTVNIKQQVALEQEPLFMSSCVPCKGKAKHPQTAGL